MGLLGLLQGHAKPLIERHFLALAGIVTTFYPYLEATPFSFEFRQAAQHGQHEPPVRCRRVGPGVALA